MTRKTLVVYRGHINNHILHPELGIANWKLSQVTARAVGEFRDRIRSAGVTVPTAREILKTLHGVLEHAKAQDWIATNPAHGTRVIGSRSEGSTKIVPPSKDDLRAVIKAADEAETRRKRKHVGPLPLMIIFAASTGARASEQWAVRWKDVDLDQGELRISRRVDVYGEVGAPKSKAGVRMVPLSAQLVTMLKAWKLRSECARPTDLIFHHAGAGINHVNLFRRQFLPLMRPGARFNWHGLRHFAVSCWIEAGLAPKTIQTFAGHASLQITMDRYGHLFPSDDHRKAMDQIARELFK